MRSMLFPFFLSLAIAAAPAAGASELPQWTNPFGMSFRLIPAGKGVIGRDGWAGVSPQRAVAISQSFGMGATEVTQGQWKAVMGGQNPSEPFLGDSLPVNRVSWEDAQRFIRKLNELDAPRRYRLPSSAEWEYACRAGNDGEWVVAGGTIATPEKLRKYEWFGPDRTTHPVAQKKPNAWGLYDMGGNVREWVQDWWRHDYYGSMPETDPAGPATGTMRVWRGGSYEDAADTCAPFSRDGDKPTARNRWTGFRVLLEGDCLRAELGAPEAEKGGISTVPADIPAAYVPVLDDLHDILANGLNGRERRDGEHGVMERWQGSEGPEALASVGWALRDLSGDGTPELLIAQVEEAEGESRGSQLYALYAIKDGKPFLVLEGTTRDTFTLLEGNALMNHGSGGMARVFGICELSEDGTVLVWHDRWFTALKESPRELACYRNSAGTLDKADSQEISEEDFDNAEKHLFALQSDELFTPFSRWRQAEDASGDTEKTAAANAPAVRLHWAEEALKNSPSHSTFTVCAEGPMVQAAVCAGIPVKGLKVLKLELAEAGEDGKVSFNSAELFNYGTLKPECPLVISMPVLGTIPQYGISYEDAEGKTLRFAVTESGMDGSLQLMPF